MAHIGCTCGKDLWNGDGKPIIWAFRVNYLYDILRKKPNIIWCSDDYYILDEFFNGGKEDPDVWFCDSCKRFSVFYGNGRDEERFNFTLTLPLPDFENEKWEKYVLFRDWEYDKFDTEVENRLLSDILRNYHFKRTCMVSQDGRFINYYEDGKLIRSYTLLESTKFIYTDKEHADQYDLNCDTTVNLFHNKEDDYWYSSREYDSYGEMIEETIKEDSSYVEIGKLLEKHTYVDVMYEDDVEGLWSYSPGDLSLKICDRVLVERNDETVSARVVKIEERSDYDSAVPHDRLKQIIRILKIGEKWPNEETEDLIPEKERIIRDKYGISPYDVLPYRTYNRDAIRKSEKCCCYHCKKIFDAREIDEWLERDADQTVICPYCGETFVLGDGSGFPVSDQEFVEALNTYWFH